MYPAKSLLYLAPNSKVKSEPWEKPKRKLCETSNCSSNRWDF